MSETVADRIEAILAPVSPHAPAGASARYEPEFDALRAEAEKISTSGGQAVDWPKVVALSAEILSKKSKDLLVLSYFAVGAFETEGYPALAATLEATSRLIDESWDGLFPEASRTKARVSAVEWLAERLAAAVAARAPGAAETGAVTLCLDRLDTLDSVLRQRLLNDAPSLGDLRGALRERETQAAPPASQAPTPQAPTVAPAPVEARLAAEPEPDLETDEGREEALKAALGTLRSIAAEIRKADPQDPFAYRFARVAAWGRVRALPSNVDGRTSVPARTLDPETLERLEQLAHRGEWLPLLAEAEEQFGRTVLWLDAQRLAATAMRGLGPGFERARQVVTHETALLVRSFPALVDLRFENDVPFASEETRAWIAESALASGAGTPSGPSRRSSAADGEEDDGVASRASDLARGGRLKEAIQALEDAAGRAASSRDRFRMRLALARMLGDAKEHRLAVAQMERIEQDIERHRLDEWDPGLAVEALEQHLRWQRLLAKSEGKHFPEIARKADELYARLARLDARAALAMKA